MSDEKIKYDTTNEKLVIRTAMGSTPEQLGELLARVRAEDFREPRHRRIWQVLGELHRRGVRYEAGCTAVEGVEREYLTALEHMGEVSQNLEWHLRALRWDAVRAEALQVDVPRLIAAAKTPGADADPQIRDAAARLLKSLGVGGVR